MKAVVGMLAALLIASGTTVLAQNGSNSQTGQRKALIVSNSEYAFLRPALPTVASDAAGLRSALASAGFDVTAVANTSLDKMDQTLDAFAKQVGPGDIVLFFFSGYAVQVGGENYLLPVSHDPAQNQEVDFAAHSVRRILSDLEDRKPAMLLMLLDAARQNDALRRRYPVPGLALLGPRTPNIFISLSAAPRRTFHDAPGNSLSLYAQALIDTMRKPGLTLDEVFREVKRTVSAASGGEQIPVEMSSVVQEFYFHALPADVHFWERIRDERDIKAFASFRRQYPDSPHAAEAERRIEQLEWESAGDKQAALKEYIDRYPSGVYVDAARARLREVEEAANRVTTRAAIDAALKRYAEAFAARDVAQLRAVWPSLGPQDIARFQENFRQAREIKIDLQPSAEPQITGDTILVPARRFLQMNFKRGALPPVNDQVVVRLRRAGADVVIDSITVQ